MLIKELRKQLKDEKTQIEIKSQISGINYGYLSISSLNESPITLSTSINDLKLRFQLLLSGSTSFSQGNYRIDNSHHAPLHQHYESFVSPLNVPNLSEALLVIFGSEYYQLEG